MHTVREPRLTIVPINALYPTQMTLGMREVREKRRHWREAGHKTKFLGAHLIPVVEGPKGRHYVIDHHHLARALHEEGITEIAVTVTARLGKLDKDGFWTYLDNRGWVHPYDEQGRRCDYAALPRRVSKLTDDPYRSLAGELRRAGGYAKDTTPFSEFLWADFLRRRVPKRRIDTHFTAALELALKLARSEEADYLPGWCGPIATT